MADVTGLAERPAASARRMVERIRQHKPRIESAIGHVDPYTPPLFVGLALGSIIGSLALFLRRSRQEALFVGLWAPTFLALGLFYSLVGLGRKPKVAEGL